MAVRFSPKILGLNAGILLLFSDSPEPNFWDCFGQSGTEFSGLFRIVWY